MNKLQVIAHRDIYKDYHYNSFPSAIKREDGTVMVAFRQANERQRIYGEITHVDTSSKGVFVTSRDGERWDGQSQIIYDHYFYGLQDPCLNLLRDGTIFATFFMWKVYDLEDVSEIKPEDYVMYGKWVGRWDWVYSIRSTDGGETWDEPIPIPLRPAGLRGNCVEMDDGAILAPLYGVEGETCNVVIFRTEDRGRTWMRFNTIEGCDGYHFEEAHLYRTESGKLLVFIRTKKKNEQDRETDKNPLYTCESLDNGKTWSRPLRRNFYSPSPFQAVRLRSGNVLMTFGHRHEPYGIRATLLDPECTNLDNTEEIVIRDDGLGRDIGYTSSVQLDGGRILITYYYYDHETGVRYIAGTLCQELVDEHM